MIREYKILYIKCRKIFLKTKFTIILFSELSYLLEFVIFMLS